MAAKMLVVVVAACLSLSSASSLLGQRGLLQNGMQPDVVAKTLSAVQEEWKAQVAVFSECDSTAKLPGSPIVNCKDAQSSFSKSCGTIANAIVQGSGGDKAIMSEYMGDVCKQRSMFGWHNLQCNAVALAISKNMVADTYQNRMSFNSAKMCTGMWSQMLTDRAQEVTKEKAEHEAADKKAAEEAAEDEKARLEEQKKEEEKETARKLEVEKQEAVAKIAEAKAKEAEAAAHAAEKKAEAEAMTAAANKKKEEAAAAEKAHLAAKAVIAAAKPEPKVLAAVSAPKKTEKVTEKAAAPKVVAEPVAKKAVNLVIAPASPAPAAAGAPSGPAAFENLNDKMPLKAAEQGFTGKKVQHADGKTAAADWQNEYASKHSSFLATVAKPASPAPAAAGGPAADTKEDLNAKMPLKAAEQGFTGKKVKHADGKTAAADWQNEYKTGGHF